MDRKKKNDEYVFKFGSLVVCDFSVSGAEFFIIGNDGKEFLLDKIKIPSKTGLILELR